MDDDADAQIAQALHARGDPFAVLEQKVFGDFQFEVAGGEAVAREGPCDGVGKVGMVEIAGRQVGGQAEFGKLPAPQGKLGTAGFQYQRLIS